MVKDGIVVGNHEEGRIGMIHHQRVVRFEGLGGRVDVGDPPLAGSGLQFGGGRHPVLVRRDLGFRQLQEGHGVHGLAVAKEVHLENRALASRNRRTEIKGAKPLGPFGKRGIGLFRRSRVKALGLEVGRGDPAGLNVGGGEL